jgi:hypothetical protein
MASKFNYAHISDVADRLIGKFGLTATLRRPAAPSTWNAGVGTPIDYPIKAILQNYTDTERTNTLIEQGDRKIVFAANGLTVIPNTGDEIIIIDAAPWSIVNVMPVEPGGIPIVYTVQVRQ